MKTKFAGIAAATVLTVLLTTASAYGQASLPGRLPR